MWIRYNATNKLWEVATNPTDPASAFTKLPLDASQFTQGSLDPAVIGAIPWANVSKTGSSLGDLATRSAGDLSSGTLQDGRFPTWVAQPYSPALFGGGGGWTVEAADFQYYKWLRYGNLFIAKIFVAGSTLVTPATNELLIVAPAGIDFGPTDTWNFAGMAYTEDGFTTPLIPGTVIIRQGPNWIGVQKTSGANFAIVANLFGIILTVVAELQ